MPSPTTELIKNKLDIVDFLRGYLTLTPAGKNFKGLCPFHHEKTPSFMVSPERQSWRCFGCSLGGDVFGFLMRYENIEFGEALRMLAERTGVELRKENPAEYRYAGLLYDLNDSAKKYFQKALAAAQVAKDYLKSRGLTPQIIEEFELGWAPNEPEALSMNLLNSGAAPQDLIQAGLSIKTERGMMLDRFRGRIMFPIHNHQGKVVGFTGRILPQIEKAIAARAAGTAGEGRNLGSGADIAKYVNSPETPIFQKSRLLYGYWKSKDAVRDAKSAFLVEGQMDFLMTYQSGVRNVIASSGTALTADHLRTLRRLAEELVVSFDNDEAGSEAAERAIELAEANDFGVKVAQFPKQFKDAAEAAQADPENIRRAVVDAVPAPRFYFAKYLPGVTGAAGGMGGAAAGASGAVNVTALKTREGLRALRAVLAKLKNISSPVERSAWFTELASRTGISVKTLEEEAEKATVPSVPVAAGAREEGEAARREASRSQLIAEELFAAAVSKNDFEMLDDCAPFFNPTQKEILRLLAAGKRKSEDPALDAMIDGIVLRASGERAAEEIATLKIELAKEFYKERRLILEKAIKNAEARGNESELGAALEELSKLPTAPEA